MLLHRCNRQRFVMPCSRQTELSQDSSNSKFRKLWIIQTLTSCRKIRRHQYSRCYFPSPDFQCGIGARSLIVTSAMLLLILVYFVLYCFFLLRAMRQLRANSNVEFKLANTIVRIQVRPLHCCNFWRYGNLNLLYKWQHKRLLFVVSVECAVKMEPALSG